MAKKISLYFWIFLILYILFPGESTIAATICSRCGITITGKYWIIDNKIYCDNCYQQVVARCDRCGRIISGKYHILDGKNYCQACYEAIAQRCRLCNEILEGEYFTSPDGKSKFCKKCYNLYPHCDDCGVPVGPVGVALGDGRNICPDCYSIAIFSDKKIQEIFEVAKKQMKDSLGMRVNFPVGQIKLVDRNNLNKIQEKQHIEYAPKDSVSGIHYYEKLNDILTISEIYVLTALTPERALGVIAHEYAHAWQAENCPDKQEPKIREGFAEWVSYKVLQAKGYSAETSILLKTSDPIYGEGLKKMLQIEKDYGLKGVLNYAREIDPDSKVSPKKPPGGFVIKEITQFPEKNQKKASFSNSPAFWLFLIVVAAVIAVLLVLSIFWQCPGRSDNQMKNDLKF